MNLIPDLFHRCSTAANLCEDEILYYRIFSFHVAFKENSELTPKLTVQMMSKLKFKTEINSSFHRYLYLEHLLELIIFARTKVPTQ